MNDILRTVLQIAGSIFILYLLWKVLAVPSRTIARRVGHDLAAEMARSAENPALSDADKAKIGKLVNRLQGNLAVMEKSGDMNEEIARVRIAYKDILREYPKAKPAGSKNAG